MRVVGVGQVRFAALTQRPLGGKPPSFRIPLPQGERVQLPKRRLSRAVDVELLARAIGVRARDEPDDRRGDVGGDGDAAEGPFRSEKRRVGKEWVSTSRTRGSPYHLKTKR